MIVLDGVEQQRFALAFYESKALRHCPPEQSISGAFDAIQLWLTLLGVPKSRFPDDDDLKMLSGFLVVNYDFLSPEEIKLAIHLSIAGKLGVKNELPFHGLTCLYISSQLNAYVTGYRAATLKNITKQTEDFYYSNAKMPPPSPEEEAQQMRDIITVEYNRFKAGGGILDFGSIIWDYLKRTKKLVVDQSFKDKALSFAEDELKRLKKSTKKAKSFFSVLERSLLEKEKDDAIKELARRFGLKEFFKQIDLETLTAGIKPSDFEPQPPKKET